MTVMLYTSGFSTIIINLNNNKSDEAGPEKKVALKVFKVKMRIKLNNLKDLVHKLDFIVILQNFSQL